MKKWGFRILGIVAIGVLFAGIFVISSPVLAEESDTSNTDVNLTINTVIALSLANCDSSDSSAVNLTIKPSAVGVFNNNCQILSIGTNAPGYELSVKASGSHPALNSGAITNSLIYQNPLPPNITVPPIVASTSNPLSAPLALTNNTWGFAVTSSNVSLASTPMANFDNSYTLGSAGSTGKYANMPTTDTTLYHTLSIPGQIDAFTFYYGARVTSDKLAGLYQTMVTYTAVAEEIITPELPTIESVTPDVILASVMDITIKITGTNLQDSQYAFIDFDNDGIMGYGEECIDLINVSSTTIYCTARNLHTHEGENKLYVVTPLGTAVYESVYYFNTMKEFAETGFCGYLIDGQSVLIQGIYLVGRLADNKCWMLNNMMMGSYVTFDPGVAAYGLLYTYSSALAVCPVHWRLPSTFEYQNLGSLYGVLGSAQMSNLWGPTGAFSGQFSGYFNSSSFAFQEQGVTGLYWTSGMGIALRFSSTPNANVNTGYSADPNDGLAVRCVAGGT